MQTHLYCFQAEISVLLRDFRTWINPPLIGHLGLFTVLAVVGLTSRREVHGCFFHSAYRHLVDNVTNSGITQGKPKFPDRMKGLRTECCNNLFTLLKRLASIRDNAGITCGVKLALGGVNMSPFLEEAFFSCFM